MKFTLSWLKEYLDTDASLAEISYKLTAIGLEVEEITDTAKDLKPFIVAEILEAKPHPNADKLQICRVNDGTQELQIVCGAPNARAGIKVILAPIGVLIPNGGFKIKKSKIRDIESCGMMCSAAELNIGGDDAGIVELPDEAIIGQEFVQFMGLDDPLIEIAITPNRGDCLGVYGIARDLAASGLGQLKPEKVTTQDICNVMDKGDFDSPINVTIENEDKCSYFIGRTFKNVKNTESPDWLKQRLESIGCNSISVLVDITNYLTFAFGRPAHVYDASKLSGDLVVRESKQNSQFQALDDKEYQIQPNMTIIADDNGVQAIGGIIGGEHSGVDENTTEIFLEMALFDSIATAETGRKLQIDSDARYRFERIVSAATLKHFITASEMITELCGYNVEVSKPVVAGKIHADRHKIILPLSKIEALLGVEIPKEQSISILESLGFKIENEGDNLEVSVPSFRPDVTIAEDLIEEIARIYGYDNIPVLPLPKSTVSSYNGKLRQMADARRSIAASGLDEVLTFSFMPTKWAKLFAENNELQTLSNPISSDLDTMAPSILPNLIDAAKRNHARGYKDIAFFEVASIFHDALEHKQESVFSGIRTGHDSAKNYHGNRTVDLLDAKADCLTILECYNVTKNKVRATRDAPSYYHPGRSGAFVQGRNILGYFGQIHPSICKKMDIKSEIFAFEVFVDRINPPKAKKTFSKGKLELSNFQAVERDFAFIVADNVAVGDIIQAVEKSEKKLLQSVSIFDVYSGKGVEDGKKSVALNIKLQPKDRTLTDEEIEAVSNAIIQNVQESVGGVLR